MADKEAAPKIAKARVVAMYPDVCKAPIPPVPFKLYAIYEDHVDVSTDVNITKRPATTEKSRITKSYGDEAGTGKGVKSGSQGGWCKPVGEWSSTVRVNGKKVLRDTTRFKMNQPSKDGAHNTEGKTVYGTGKPLSSVQKGAVTKDANPLVQLTPKEADWLKGLKEAGEAAKKWAEENKIPQRLGGIAQISGGVGEIGGGAGLIAVPTGVTQVVGTVFVAHGFDNVYTGIKQAWTGDVQKTLTEQWGTDAAQSMGANPELAAAIGEKFDTALGTVNPSKLGNVLKKEMQQAEKQAAKEAAKDVAKETENAEKKALEKEAEDATKKLEGSAEKEAKAKKEKKQGKDGAKVKKNLLLDSKVEGAPPVHKDRQGKHVKGHKNNAPGKSTWADGVDNVSETQNAWLKGEPVPGQPQCRSFDTGRPIGSNGETWIKVHYSNDFEGCIHGVPTSR